MVSEQKAAYRINGPGDRSQICAEVCSKSTTVHICSDLNFREKSHMAGYLVDGHIYLFIIWLFAAILLSSMETAHEWTARIKTRITSGLNHVTPNNCCLNHVTCVYLLFKSCDSYCMRSLLLVEWTCRTDRWRYVATVNLTVDENIKCEKVKLFIFSFTIYVYLASYSLKPGSVFITGIVKDHRPVARGESLRR